MSLPSYAVLFRTHFWDEYSKKMAKNTSARIKSGDFYILADETNQELWVSDYKKISHKSDFTEISLTLPMHKSPHFMWHSGDLPLYHAAIMYPQYDYYCMIEYDVLINRSFDSIMLDIKNQNIDAVGFRMRKAPPNIGAQVKHYFKNENSLLPCIFIASKRCVEYLYKERQRVRENFLINHQNGWPFCEGFLGAAISDNPDLKYENLNSFGNTSKYEFHPPYLYQDNLIREESEFIHPVLDEKRFAKSCIKHGADDFFTENSRLNRDLLSLSPDIYIPILRQYFNEKNQKENITRLDQYIADKNLTGYLSQPIPDAPSSDEKSNNA